jgi:hypothetical protein
VVYQNLSEADFAAALKSVGLPAGLADMLADSDGYRMPFTLSAREVVGRPINVLRVRLSSNSPPFEAPAVKTWSTKISAKPTSPPR